MRALGAGVPQLPCGTSPTASSQSSETSSSSSTGVGLRVGKGGAKPWSSSCSWSHSASTFGRPHGGSAAAASTSGNRRWEGGGRRTAVVTRAASMSTLLFLSALPFAIVGLVWVGVGLMISRIEYEYYEELRELEEAEAEAERQRLIDQGLESGDEIVIVGEGGEALEGGLKGAPEPLPEPQPVGAGGGKRKRPVREE